jgi:hypothetical protein
VSVGHFFLEIMTQDGVGGSDLGGKLALVALRILTEDAFQVCDRILVDLEFPSAGKFPNRISQLIQ